MRLPPRVAAFDWPRVAGFLNGAAYAQAARAHIYQGSSRFSENKIANALLVAITGEPGYPEVQMDAIQIQRSQRAHFGELLHSATLALYRGPREFAQLLETTANQRAENTIAVRRVFRETLAAANRIAGDLGAAIKGLAAVELASTVAISVTPVGLTFAGASAAAAAGWIGFGYGVTKSLAKDLSEAKDASVIAFDLSKEASKTGIDAASQKLESALEKHAEHNADLIEKAEQKIADLSRLVQAKVSASKIAKLNRRIARQEAALVRNERAALRAQMGRLAARSLTVVFAAHDVYDAWEECVKVWESS